MASRLPVAGALYPSTKDGFAKMLSEANKAAKQGYELVTIVRVDAQLGAVFQLRQGREPPLDNSFFE